MGVLYAARGHGLAVPRDLSVIGVDGHDFAYLFDLTTISQPVRDQGQVAGGQGHRRRVDKHVELLVVRWILSMSSFWKSQPGFFFTTIAVAPWKSMLA